jgi:hypothetical protein
VELELAFAREQAKTVVPIFIEPVVDNERFHNYLGVEATSPQAFADAVHRLMRNLYLTFDLDLPAADPVRPGCASWREKSLSPNPLFPATWSPKPCTGKTCKVLQNSVSYALDDALNGSRM